MDKKRQQGAALLMVLVALAMLAGGMAWMVEQGRQQVDSVRLVQQRVQARAIERAALAFTEQALQDPLWRASPLFWQAMRGQPLAYDFKGGKASIQIRDLHTCFNVNALIGPEAERAQRQLVHLLGADMAAERYRQWLNQTRAVPKLHVYRDRADFARRLMKTDRFLTAERADYLSRHLAKIGEGHNKAGERRHGVIWNGDPWHKNFSPYLFRLEESMAIWREARCPVLWVAGRQSWVVRDFEQRPGDWEARQACFAQLTERWIDNADHMLHHDQPEEVARLIEEFLT